jgi:hypothetical protein
MSYGPPRGTFLFLGVIFGALFGFIYSLVMPLVVNKFADLFTSVNIYGIIILAFLILQYILGIILRRPYKSRNLNWGLLIIPITWFYPLLLPVSLDSLLEYLVFVILFEVPMLLLLLIAIIITSQFLPFLAGYNTHVLDCNRLPSEAIFSYDLKLPQNERIEEETQKLIDRILNATGFRVYRKSLTNQPSGWVLCEKEETDQGLFYETAETSLKITSFFFSIANDTVKIQSDREKILDSKAQIFGLLDDWVKRNVISGFKQSEPNIRVGLEQISRGLGPLRIPRERIWYTIKGYPKAHPFQFALLTTLIQILVTVALFLLSR